MNEHVLENSERKALAQILRMKNEHVLKISERGLLIDLWTSL